MTTKTHGMEGTYAYKSWACMKLRCTSPNAVRYDRYGGRGISYDPHWEQFENFYADMGPRPLGKTLDRIDNNKDYCKENCRWATPAEQANNRSTTVKLTYKNETLNMKDWARKLGWSYTHFQRLCRRYKNNPDKLFRPRFSK